MWPHPGFVAVSSPDGRHEGFVRSSGYEVAGAAPAVRMAAAVEKVLGVVTDAGAGLEAAVQAAHDSLVDLRSMADALQDEGLWDFGGSMALATCDGQGEIHWVAVGGISVYQSTAEGFSLVRPPDTLAGHVAAEGSSALGEAAGVLIGYLGGEDCYVSASYGMASSPMCLPRRDSMHRRRLQTLNEFSMARRCRRR